MWLPLHESHRIPLIHNPGQYEITFHSLIQTFACPFSLQCNTHSGWLSGLLEVQWFHTPFTTDPYKLLQLRTDVYTHSCNEAWISRGYSTFNDLFDLLFFWGRRIIQSELYTQGTKIYTQHALTFHLDLSPSVAINKLLAESTSIQLVGFLEQTWRSESHHHG